MYSPKWVILAQNFWNFLKVESILLHFDWNFKGIVLQNEASLRIFTIPIGKYRAFSTTKFFSGPTQWKLLGDAKSREPCKGIEIFCDGDSIDETGLKYPGVFLGLIRASGIWALGIWALGIWALGIWALGIWALGIWALGIWALEIWALEIWALGVWVLGIWARGIWALRVWALGVWALG